MPITDLSELVDELLSGTRPLPIIPAGVPVLRQPALPYEGQLAADQLDRLLAAMREAMHSAPGVGLAAPQIGVPLRLAVIEDPAEVTAEVREARGRVPQPYRVLVNPVYEAVGDGRAAFFEGCLSIPGWQAVVSRPDRIRLRGQDVSGRELDEEFTGWPARIVQHETDHLDGVLYLDLAETRSLSSAQAVSDYWSQPTPAAAARSLDFPLRTTADDNSGNDNGNDNRGATAP
ncbi:peptide deformylase [Streptomyces luomodiensis]|uniref:Peptide deformylase n=1 Tax=Streptomyces luomodiensis TaxID=3026192 RepID=A0ABY9UQD9_9ACTN|nr:peptide deformylase [Streptomyces sp. SCA4-21]WNE94776.1 peptide deformylase [Streptomyces sp. SCA4-21]